MKQEGGFCEICGRAVSCFATHIKSTEHLRNKKQSGFIPAKIDPQILKYKARFDKLGYHLSIKDVIVWDRVNKLSRGIIDESH